MKSLNSFRSYSAGAALGLAALASQSCVPGEPDSVEESTGYNVDAVWDAPACGTVIGSYDGTNAYSNGSKTGTGVGCAGQGAFGLQYQCVELVMRHFKTHWGLKWAGNAADLLANAPAGDVDVRYNGDGAHMPVAGDMIVWTDTAWGHVALVTSVSGSSISILEQNVFGAGGTATLPISGGKIHGPAGWGWSDPHGWAHAKANQAGGGNGGGSTGSSDPCSHATFGGQYCGQSTQYGFGPGQADVLYDCENQVITHQSTCTGGCQVMPAGDEDACRPDPCKAAAYGGRYCGQSTQYGFVGGVTNWLYDCENHTTKSHVACSNGCIVMPAGQEDHCQ